MAPKKKTLAEQLADEARRQLEESKKKKAAQAQAESLMAKVEAKLKAQQTEAQKAAEKAAEAKSQAESLMADVESKLKARQPKVAPKPKAAEPEIYVVQPGDSLSKIAKEKFGDMSRWPEIFEANKETIKDPNLIQVGQKLIIPR